MISGRFKELTKFAAGITAWECVVHSTFALCDMLPLEFCGFTLTKQANTIQIIASGSVTILLVWFSWFKTLKSDSAW